MFLTTNELREIEAILAERLKVDYTHFNGDFFRRRLAYLFEKMGLHRVQELGVALGSPIKADEMAFYLSVPQTELFRAPAFWRQLRKDLADGGVKNIYLPCLSSYHELFSLLVTLDMAGRKDCRVVANVISDRIAASVNARAVSKKDEQQDRSNFERLETQHSYEDYFPHNEAGAPELRADLLRGVSLRNGWFMNFDDEKYDLIIFRDVLLGYDRTLHAQAVTHLADSLSRPGAMLCLGVMERPLGAEGRLAPQGHDGVYSLLCGQ